MTKYLIPAIVASQNLFGKGGMEYEMQSAQHFYRLSRRHNSGVLSGRNLLPVALVCRFAAGRLSVQSPWECRRGLSRYRRNHGGIEVVFRLYRTPLR